MDWRPCQHFEWNISLYYHIHSIFTIISFFELRICLITFSILVCGVCLCQTKNWMHAWIRVMTWCMNILSRLFDFWYFVHDIFLPVRLVIKHLKKIGGLYNPLVTKARGGWYKWNLVQFLRKFAQFGLLAKSRKWWGF